MTRKTLCQARRAPQQPLFQPQTLLPAGLFAADPHVNMPVQRVPPPVRTRIEVAAQAVGILHPLIGHLEREALVALALDRRGAQVDTPEILSLGSDAYTIVDPKAILRWALTRSRPVSGIVIAHNHPSGTPSPSSEDREVTARVAQACGAIGMVLVDHLILTGLAGCWYSFAEAGEIQVPDRMLCWPMVTGGDP